MTSPVRLIVCINKRLGTGQRSCVDSGSLDYIARIRAMISEHDLGVAIVERECLGKCEQGPVMRIAPAGRFFTEIDEAKLDSIILELKAFIASRGA